MIYAILTRYHVVIARVSVVALALPHRPSSVVSGQARTGGIRALAVDRHRPRFTRNGAATLVAVVVGVGTLVGGLPALYWLTRKGSPTQRLRATWTSTRSMLRLVPSLWNARLARGP